VKTAANTVAKIPRETLAEFCRRWNIREVAYFGSVLREDFSPQSDVDVLVTFAPDADWGLFDHATMQRELSELLGRDVDLLTRRAVEHSDNWKRRQEILSTAKVVYAA
jgi:predicted nucleotidyltransferase